MKELNVKCNLYIALDPDEEVEHALDRILAMVDPDLGINIHEYEVQEA